MNAGPESAFKYEHLKAVASWTYLELRQELISGTGPLVTLSGLGQPQDLLDIHLLQRANRLRVGASHAIGREASRRLIDGVPEVQTLHPLPP